MLKTLMLKRKIADAMAKLDALRSAKADLEKREAELESAIAEANTDEEQAAVDAEIAQHEADTDANAQETERLEKEISDLEAELAEVESRQNKTTGSQAEDVPAEPTNSRKVEVNTMHKRFAEMTMEQRTAFVERDNVRKFLGDVRSLFSKRSVTNVDVTIPEEVVALLRPVIDDNSKLIKHVNKQGVNGKSRQPILGITPEGIWTEQCGKINELDFSFAEIEVDGFKVAGFTAVCNSKLEDSDIDLLETIINGLGQAIGKALDKAIVFGTGVKMPKGIFTTLPSENKVSIPSTVTKADLFGELAVDAALADDEYSNKDMFWVMNRTTKAAIVKEATGFDASGAVVAGIQNTMPVVGGEIVVLSFMPDNMIVGGFGDLYLLAERAGTTVSQSEHVRFIEDQTVIKGTARYDGEAAIKAGFVAIGIKGTTPSASGITFAPDTANPSNPSTESVG